MRFLLVDEKAQRLEQVPDKFQLVDQGALTAAQDQYVVQVYNESDSPLPQKGYHWFHQFFEGTRGRKADTETGIDSPAIETEGIFGDWG